MQSNEAQGQGQTLFQRHRNAIIGIGAILVLLLECCLATRLLDGEEPAPEGASRRPWISQRNKLN